MERLLLLADSKRYLKQNCYQSQLLITLQRNFKVKIVDARRINSNRALKLEPFDHVLSVLKLRTLDGMLDALARQLGHCEISVYEQDPWEGFMDESPYKGAYGRINDALNVKAFLNTSQWWSDYVKGKGLRSRFVRMGMLPEYCEVGTTAANRKIGLGFQGTIHTHRKVFFDRLCDLGCQVTILPSTPYGKFLKKLQDIRIYIHTEDAPWKLDGTMVPRNALWIKDTEAAARGCFSIRDYEVESAAYDIDELPTIFTFRSVEDVPDIVAGIAAMSDDEKDERMKRSVEVMRQRNDWMTVVNAVRAS